MKEEVIIEAAREFEKSTGLGDIVLRARGVNSAAGIGFLEGAVWMQEQIIDKACEWLLNNIRYYSTNALGAEYMCNDFRKAMEE